MDDRKRQIKNSRLLTLEIANFARKIEKSRKTPIREEFGIGGNFRGWKLKLTKSTRRNVDYLNVFLVYRTDKTYLLQSFQYHFCVVNHEEPERNVQRGHVVRDNLVVTANREKKVMHGFKKFVRLDELLDEDEGYLKDGKLTVRVEVRIDFFEYNGWYRVFNFNDPFENCITFHCEDKTLYANRQIILHHCKAFRAEIMAGKVEFQISFRSSRVNLMFQAIHGVWEWFDQEDIGYASMDFYKAAEFFDAVEPLRQIGPSVFNCLYWGDISVNSFPAHFINLRLEEIRTLVKLQEDIQDWEPETLNSDTIKMVTRKFFSLAMDPIQVVEQVEVVEHVFVFPEF